MTAYYNEHDKGAAAWLRELIKAGLIAAGDVDERSIVDVRADELLGYTQCHFFAGVGGWSLALRNAGWPDDREVWTGSCPCQPFSNAGKGDGFADERHLWSEFYCLIAQRRPSVAFGEQVASKDGLAWLDLVRADLDASGYAFGAADLCSAGVGAPHIRQRLYWVANAAGARSQGREFGGQRTDAQQPAAERSGGVGRLAETNGAGRSQGREGLAALGHGAPAGADRGAGGLANAEQHDRGCEAEPADHLGAQVERPADQHGGHRGAPAPWPSSTHSLWRDADWLACRDGKWRPVEPGTFPLVAKLSPGLVPSGRTGLAIDANNTSEARVMRLRGYGNAIDTSVATTFIAAFCEARDE